MCWVGQQKATIINIIEKKNPKIFPKNERKNHQNIQMFLKQRKQKLRKLNAKNHKLQIISQNVRDKHKKWKFSDFKHI